MLLLLLLLQVAGVCEEDPPLLVAGVKELRWGNQRGLRRPQEASPRNEEGERETHNTGGAFKAEFRLG